jgi:hypothetical protein
MGRAMLIFCAAALIAIGFINITTSKKGLALTEQNVNYADFIMAKNAAHTAIQISMQNINKDDTWADTYDQGNPWITTVNDREVELYTIHNPHADFWEPDSLRMISNAKHNDITVQVISQYLKEPFSALVPDFTGALQLPTGIGNFNVDGNAYDISGTPPSAHNCPDSKPPVTTSDETTKQKVDDAVATHNQLDGDVSVDTDLNYEPTDELIERLYNSGNAITVNSDFGSTLGTASNPGVFFVEGDVKLTGQQKEGYGILVIRSDANMEMEDPNLSVAGNFTFNGLVIFENAYNFDGRGTPTINGSVLVGQTDDHTGDPIDINLGGDISINYDCKGEDYAKQAAALAVEQYKYTRIVTTEGANFFHDSPVN